VKFQETSLPLHQLYHISTRQPNTPGSKKPYFGAIKITHPFHPDYRSQFIVTSIQSCWGEQRIAYYDKKGAIRFIPITWTDKKPFDPFLEVSSGKSFLHNHDIKGLLGLLRSMRNQNSENNVENAD